MTAAVLPLLLSWQGDVVHGLLGTMGHSIWLALVKIMPKSVLTSWQVLYNQHWTVWYSSSLSSPALFSSTDVASKPYVTTIYVSCKSFCSLYFNKLEKGQVE